MSSLPPPAPPLPAQEKEWTFTTTKIPTHFLALGYFGCVIFQGVIGDGMEMGIALQVKTVYEAVVVAPSPPPPHTPWEHFHFTSIANSSVAILCFLLKG